MSIFVWTFNDVIAVIGMCMFIIFMPVYVWLIWRYNKKKEE